jgi:hypothetical protein
MTNNTPSWKMVNNMDKTILHRKKQFVPSAFKFMLAVGSLAGTLGIWNLLAKQDLQASAQSATTDAINQAPLPTLVPLTTVNITSSGVTINSTPLRQVTTSSNSNSSASVTSSNQTSNPVFIPAPVTTTRSSRR